MIDIFSLSVEEMASQIKNGQLTSAEVCERYIERINKFEKDTTVVKAIHMTIVTERLFVTASSEHIPRI